MQQRRILHAKTLIFTLLSIALILSFSGCGTENSNVQAGTETTPSAYDQPESQTTPETRQDTLTSAEKKLTQIDQTDAKGNVTTTVFSYDDNGLLVSAAHTDQYNTVTYTYIYDEANRLIETWSSGWGDLGPTIKYHYDANGYLVEISGIGEGGGTGGTYENDSSGRPVCYIEGGDAFSSVTEYTYSDDGRTVNAEKTSTGYNGDISTERTTYTYDAQGRLVSEEIFKSDRTELHNYSYDYKPFTAIAEEGTLPYRYSINDINGHEIWSLYTGIPESIETDDQGYVTTIVFDSTVIGGKTYRNPAVYQFSYDGQVPSEKPEIPESTTAEVKITEEEAYKIACDYWNYSEGDISPATGFEMFVVPDHGEPLKEDADTGEKYYCYLLRWLVLDENGNSYLSTCDIICIDAQTGECFY